MLRVQTTIKADFPGNPLPVLWIKSQRAAHRVTCFRGQVGSKNCTHRSSLGSGSAVVGLKSPHLSLWLLSLLWPGILANQQEIKLYWVITRCRGFFLLPSFLPLPLGFIQASEILPWSYFSQIKIPQSKWTAVSYFPSCLGLHSILRLEQKEREELFQIQAAAGLTMPFTPTVLFADHKLNIILAFLPHHCLQTTLIICFQNLHFAVSSFKYIIIRALWVKGRVVRSPGDSLFARMRMMQFLDLNSNSTRNYRTQTTVYLLGHQVQSWFYWYQNL